MDLQTAKDYIEDLLQERTKLLSEIDELKHQLRMIETERDQWQIRSIGND